MQWKNKADESIQLKRILLQPQIDKSPKIVLCKLRKEDKKFEELHTTALLLPACCLRFEWCELCSTLSTIRSLHSYERTGQSEINVLSLGNTQEMVSFIVLSPADNCFATFPQMRKLWVCEIVWVTVCVCVCVSTVYCNIFSNNHSINCFSVTFSLSLFLSALSENCQLSMWSEENLCWNFVAPIDCGVWGLILLFLPSCWLFCANMRLTVIPIKLSWKKCWFILPPSSVVPNMKMW